MGSCSNGGVGDASTQPDSTHSLPNGTVWLSNESVTHTMDQLSEISIKVAPEITCWQDLVAKATQTKKIRHTEGEYLSKTPCGYRWQGRSIVPDLPCAAAVRSAFMLADSGHTLSQILFHVNTPSFIEAWGRPLRKSSLHLILTNPLYYGLMRASGALYHGSHIPLVSSVIFARVQRKLSDRHR